MRERPILFSGEMVRALLDGRKTQTRRVVKGVQHEKDLTFSNGGVDYLYGARFGGPVPCPYGAPGDRLWVRETWTGERMGDGTVLVAYRASCDDDRFDFVADDGSVVGLRVVRWKPAIHMPRSVCRLVLELTDVRVERVQSISYADVMAEGCPPGEEDPPSGIPGDEGSWFGPALWYQRLWDSLNATRDGGAYRWDANPWVWVLTFRRAPSAAGGAS